jgi:hypothetical protein
MAAHPGESSLDTTLHLNYTNSSYSTQVSEIVFDLLLICLLDDDLVFADTNEHLIAN